jgi:hypothetical protein
MALRSTRSLEKLHRFRMFCNTSMGGMKPLHTKGTWRIIAEWREVSGLSCTGLCKWCRGHDRFLSGFGRWLCYSNVRHRRGWVLSRGFLPLISERALWVPTPNLSKGINFSIRKCKIAQDTFYSSYSEMTCIVLRRMYKHHFFKTRNVKGGILCLSSSFVSFPAAS